MLCCLQQALAARLDAETTARRTAEERVVIMEDAFGAATGLLTVRLFGLSPLHL